MASSGHSCGRRDLSFWCMDSLVKVRRLRSSETGEILVKVRGLRSSEAGEILVPPPGVEPRSPVLQGRFLASGPLVKS